MGSMSAQVVIYRGLIPDEQMKAHLERRDTLIFNDLSREWQDIERQVERLGFGDLFVVSQRASNGRSTRVSAEPIAARTLLIN